MHLRKAFLWPTLGGVVILHAEKYTGRSWSQKQLVYWSQNIGNQESGSDQEAPYSIKPQGPPP